MAKRPAQAKQLSLMELNELIADFKPWLDDAREAWSADKLSEYLRRLAFLSANNSALHHVLAFGLPRVDVGFLVKSLNDAERTWHRRSTPIEWPLDPEERLAMQFALLIAIGESRIEFWRLL